MADPYFSEIKYLGGASLDFIEVAVDAGTDVSDLVVTIYFSGGTIRSSNAVAGLSNTTVAGKDVYVIELGAPSSFSGLAKSNAVSLSDSSGVYQFVSFTDNAAAVTASEGPASGLTSTEIGQAGAGSSLESTDGGATYDVQTNPTPTEVPCLTTGTLVQGAHDWVPVETLVAGQRLRTLDGSLRPVRQILRTAITARDMRRNPKLRPVRICAGALGHGIPRRDLLVSRQHRMLVSSRIVKRMFGTPEVLVAANRLTDLPGVYVDDTLERVEYVHVLFEDHEVIYAEGAPTESLLWSKSEASGALHARLAPDIAAIAATASPHMIPSRKRQSRLVQRHLDNARQLVRPRDAKLSRGLH